MSKFKNLILDVMLQETDWDDPTERYWDRSPVSTDTTIKKDTLYTKPINPLKNQDEVYIKCVTFNVSSPSMNAVMYLTGNEDFKYTFDVRKAKKFPLEAAQVFIDKHQKEQFEDMGKTYERHFELEKAE